MTCMSRCGEDEFPFGDVQIWFYGGVVVRRRHDAETAYGFLPRRPSQQTTEACHETEKTVPPPTTVFKGPISHRTPRLRFSSPIPSIWLQGLQVDFSFPDRSGAVKVISGFIILRASLFTEMAPKYYWWVMSTCDTQ